jgi:hypothetical protein
MSSVPDLQVYVQPWPQTGAKYQVTTGGGRTPVWSRDGTRLFFHHVDANQIMMTEVRHTGAALSFGAPVPLPVRDTVHPPLQRNFDVTPDG